MKFDDSDISENDQSEKDVQNSENLKKQNENIDFGILGTSGISAGGFLKSPYVQETDSRPDLQISVYSYVPEPYLKDYLFKYSPNFLHNTIKNEMKASILVTLSLLHSEATQEILLSPNSKKDKDSIFLGNSSGRKNNL